MSRIFLVLACLSLLPDVAIAQESREFQVLFDSLASRTIEGRSISEWLRPVIRHEDIQLSADNGQDEGNGYVRFWGNVKIIEKEDTIWTDKLRYHKDTKVGFAEGNVLMTDGTVQLRSPTATHYSEEDLTRFEDGVEYRDSTTVLLAEKAVYRSESNEAEFRRNVLLKQDGLTMQADSLAYFREDELSRAWGRILVTRIDSLDTAITHILADSLFRDAARDSIAVSGYARLVTIDADAADTVYVSARSIVLQKDDQMSATDSVVVSSTTYEITGDSLKTYKGSNGFRVSEIRGNPIAWVEKSQIVATFLRLVAGEKADSLFGESEVFVATMDSVTARVNQLKGEKLKVMIVQDSVRTIEVEDNAEAVLFFQQEEGGETVGYRGSGDGIRIDVSSDSTRVGFYEGVEGTYYAGHLLDQLLNLAGYIYEPDSRPSRLDIALSFWADYERVKASSSADESTE